METIKIKSQRQINDATKMNINNIDVLVNYHEYRDKFPLITVTVDYKNKEYFGTFDVLVEGSYTKTSNFKGTEEKVVKVSISGYEITGIEYQSNSTDKELMKFSNAIMDNLIKDRSFIEMVKRAIK